MRTRYLWAALLPLVWPMSALQAQDTACAFARGAHPGSEARAEVRARLLWDSAASVHSWMKQRTSDLAAVCGDAGSTLSVLPLRAVAQQRTGYADDRNNAALWSGRGFNGAVSGGIRLQWGVLSAVLAPTLTYSANAEVPLQPLVVEGNSPFANPYHADLDWPQRFGDESLTRLDPGQSVLRVDYRGLAAGVSTENLWWGPGQRSALLMGSTAPGFAHVFLGTGRPVETRAGTFEVEAVWANLEESEWFDTIPENDRRRMSAIVATWAPPVLTGLQLGAARLYHFTIPDEGLSFGTWALPFLEGLVKDDIEQEGDGRENQLAAVFMRWALPAAGFEAYWEMVRDDHSQNLHDLLAQPGHQGGYLVGFQKAWQRESSQLRLLAEHMDISNTQKPQAGRPTPAIYTHFQVKQGHTHRGSMLGAATGPGSTGTYVALDWRTDGWGIGGFAERVVRDDDTFYRRWAPRFSYQGQDLEWTVGGRGDVTRGALRVDATAAVSRRHNMLFIGLSQFNYETSHRDNWLLETRVTWAPGAAR